MSLCFRLRLGVSGLSLLLIISVLLIRLFVLNTLSLLIRLFVLNALSLLIRL